MNLLWGNMYQITSVNMLTFSGFFVVKKSCFSDLTERGPFEQLIDIQSRKQKAKFDTLGCLFIRTLWHVGALKKKKQERDNIQQSESIHDHIYCILSTLNAFHCHVAFCLWYSVLLWTEMGIFRFSKTILYNLLAAILAGAKKMQYFFWNDWYYYPCWDIWCLLQVSK